MDNFFSNTPIQRLSSNLYIKREDLLPYSFGGNKARKARLFFNEIDSGDYNCVVTYGSSSSNHCRVVANMAAERGMQCYIISPLEASACTFNSQIIQMLGAQTVTVPVEKVSQRIDEMMDDLRKNGARPYFIAGGGHGNIGTQAYVDCYNEIRCFEKTHGVHFDYIFFATGTGTTQAGLVCGQLIHGDERKIVGISIARKNPRGRMVVSESVHSYLNEKQIIAPAGEIEKKIIFVDEYTANGYGRQNRQIDQTIHDVLLEYGIPLDETYTGKAFCGMKQYMVQHSVHDKTILFIHTGGTPLFFDHLKTKI